jgi:hypothetical protein
MTPADLIAIAAPILAIDGLCAFALVVFLEG